MADPPGTEALVGIGKIAIAIYLPQVRNLHAIPLGLVRGELLVGDGRGPLKEAELPRAGQLDNPRDSSRLYVAARSAVS